MTDVIKNVNSNQISGAGNAKATPQPSNNKDKSSSADSVVATQVAQGDQVELTGSVKKLDDVISSLANEPIVDRQKVEAVKQALAEGRYQVDSANVAQKLIEIEELLR